MEKQIISARQYTIITLLFSIGTAILIIPASIAQDVKQDAWIAATVGVALSLLLVKLYVSLGKTTASLSFIEANEKILGKMIGKLMSIGFVIFTSLSVSELLYFIGKFMQTEVMPETPTFAFAFLFILIIMYATYLGLEVFARSAEILFPVFILIFAVFFICISPQIDIQNIQPVFESSTSSLLFSILFFMSGFSFPMVVLLMIFPSAVNVQKSAQKGFYIGTLLGGMVLIAVITLSILVLGAKTTSFQSYPSYDLAQKISIGNFFQRIEIIMTFMWITTIYIRIFIYFYATVVGLGQILNLKDYRPLILPLGMILVALSEVVHPNIVHANMYNKEIWLPFSSVFAIFLPVLLLLVAKIRKIKDKNENNKVTSQSEKGN